MESKEEVKALVVTKPEEWTPASEIKSEVTIDETVFAIRALSYAEAVAADLETPMPKPPLLSAGGQTEPNFQNQNYQDEHTEAEFKRLCRNLDTAAITLDGTTLKEKSLWAVQNLKVSSMRELFAAILNQSGRDRIKNKPSGVVKVNNAAEWAKRSSRKIVLEVTRQTGLLEFHLKPLSQAEADNIERNFPKPDVPQIRRRELDGRAGPLESNPNDPEYKRKDAEAGDKRMVATLGVVLPFKIPGDDITAQLAWLTARPCEEVTGLYGMALSGIDYHRLADFTRGR